VLECWSVGVLECWSVGALECWSVGVLPQLREVNIINQKTPEFLSPQSSMAQSMVCSSR
jgi:hypothetical protein